MTPQLSLRAESVSSAAPMTPAEIVGALEASYYLPAEALRQAVERADEIAPAVIAVVEKAAERAYLLPREDNLFFWGIHALAAARHQKLFQPFVRSLRQLHGTEEVDRLLGDACTQTLAQVVLGLYDDDADTLFAVCGQADVDGAVRWHLMLALARLTFDGKIPRSATLAFLDRFERESLAADGDLAWLGWQDALWLLGAREFFPRMRATWSDGRAPDENDRGYWERQFALADSIDFADPARFEEVRAVALEDPVVALGWTQETPSEERSEHLDRYGPDPADIVALNPFERAWLTDFLFGPKVPPNIMSFEQIDGLFTAMLAGPSGPSLDENLSAIWIEDDASEETEAKPSYDSPEQAAYFESLLRRHWSTISLRLQQGYPHAQAIGGRVGKGWGRGWSGGFLRGVALRAEEWHLRAHDPNIGGLVNAIFTMATDPAVLKGERIDPELRERFFAMLPERLVSLHHAWRGLPDPFPRAFRPPNASGGRKIGRNERCPCGSGKKYKFCCGAPGKDTSH